MLKFYYNGSPNPTKVALLLEETGLPYEAVPVDTRKGEQHRPEFLAINPNGKVPVIVDGEVTVFDSNAILLYLAEKTGKFLPPDTPEARGELLSWLMFVATGVGPYSGQAVHFRHFAPQPQDYLIPKFRWSTFHQTYFDLALRSRGIDTLIISGGAVDVGIASTVYAARDHDYNIIVVRDACSNSYEDSMKAFMDTVFPRMARVRSTDQVLEMIRQAGR